MSRPPFADRADAGRALAGPLAALGTAHPLVVGLARGGVPVAAAIVAALGEGELDVGVARKVTRPGLPEAGLGAVAAEGEPVWFDRALEVQGLAPSDLAEQVDAERAEARHREDAYGGTWRTRAAGRDVVLCDDGIATGVTVRAALGALVAAGPSRLVLATPVAAPSALRRIAAEWGGTVVALHAPERFRAVGDAYADFTQLSDDDVRAVLA